MDVPAVCSLEELRIGLRRPEAINDLPAGLWGYYADQIYTWKHDPAWDGTLLPLVATLGVAAEPLPAAALARLAGNLDPPAVRRLCESTFRPLLTTTRATRDGPPRRYEIYHASFRDVLKAAHGVGSGWPGGGQPDDVEALADELRQAALAAHARIADTYLTCFGSLDDGLPVLAGNARIAEVDEGYPLRHLAHHLQHAGRQAELHRLLAADYLASTGQAVNVWYAAHDYANCLVGYLDDLDRARALSAGSADDTLAQHGPARELGTEIRYSLIAASIAGRSANIPPQLLDLMIRTGMWSPERGLDHARHLTEPLARAQALARLAFHLPEHRQAGVLAEALAAASAITDNYSRAKALIALAPYLPENLLASALATAADIAGEYARVEALTGLAPHLPEDLLAKALAAASTITHFINRADVLTGLAPHLPEGLLASALTAAAEIDYGFPRGDALTGLAPYLPEYLLPDALATAAAITNSICRSRVQTALAASHLPEDQRRSALGSALARLTP